MVSAFAIDRAARTVHHPAPPTPAQQPPMRPAKTIAGTRDDGHAIVEADCHSSVPNVGFTRLVSTLRGVGSTPLQDHHRSHGFFHADDAAAVLGERDLRAFHLPAAETAPGRGSS